VSEDAEWCGQCFTDLREAKAEVSTKVAAAAATDSEGGTPTDAEGGASTGAAAAATWPCPACGEANPIERDTCRVCGTPFGQLLRRADEAPKASPRDAALWSLAFPGIGHAKVGRGGDGIARGTFFVLTFGLTLVIAFSGVSNAALGGVVVLLLLVALTVYLGSAYEAYRIAEGGTPLVSSRVLLWATVGVVMLSVVLLAASVLTVGAR
jgi:hypothetical protein